MDEMAALGVTWVTLAYGALQATAPSTTIAYAGRADRHRRRDPRRCRPGPPARPQGLPQAGGQRRRRHVARVHRVLRLGTCPAEPSWAQWFDAYREFVVTTPGSRQSCRVEMFCIGCEMVRADSQEAHWRELIADVREVYDGLVTYNCDKYQEDHVTWWDRVDVISASGYYPSGTWPEQLDRIGCGRASARASRSCSSRRAARAARGRPERPNDWTLVRAHRASGRRPRYLDEMLFCLRGSDPGWAASCSGTGRPRSTRRSDAATNDDYCMYAKEGAAVVRRHYLAARG